MRPGGAGSQLRGHAFLPRTGLVDLPDVSLLESVPNFSAARDARVVSQLQGALASRASVLDVHTDEDHNRSVFTLAGSSRELVDALERGMRIAIESIDLSVHRGAHPRIGAADVLPIVPMRVDDEECAHEAARELADRIALLDVPVFFYGRLSKHGHGPAYFRRGGSDGLAHRLGAGELTPDRGPGRLHPTAGGVLIGVRDPLIAFNVFLRSGDLRIAKTIASRLRESSGGLPGVRALGLELPATRRVQVSMSIEDWRVTPPHRVVEAVMSEARACGVEVDHSELVGLMPVGAVTAAAEGPLALLSLTPAEVLEPRLLEVLSDPRR